MRQTKNTRLSPIIFKSEVYKSETNVSTESTSKMLNTVLMAASDKFIQQRYVKHKIQTEGVYESVWTRLQKKQKRESEASKSQLTMGSFFKTTNTNFRP